MTRIYFDHSASTPLDPTIKNKMEELADLFGNPSSLHREGQRARAVLDEARLKVADILGTKREEIIFTSGGTESDNLALRGLARKHIVISTIEHHAVLDTALDLNKNYGTGVSYVGVDKNGVVDLADLKKKITPETSLVSVMLINNETGVKEPIKEISLMIKQLNTHRKNKIYFHTDAVQAALSERLIIGDLGVDALSLSAHKFSGPKGAGILFLKKGSVIKPQMTGGGQERNMRSGTENAAGAMGLAMALEKAQSELVKTSKKTSALTQKLAAGIRKIFPRSIELSKDAFKAPNIVSFLFPGHDAETLLISLDMAGIAASSGSACTIGSVEPSHVVLAMGHKKDLARSLIRFSLGAENTPKEVDSVLAVLAKLL